MDWHCLGHAMWLAEVDGLRLLFDPLLEDRHHGDVFEVFPPRTIEAEALRADFLFVSHRHPDHFDIPSLRRLAELDPETVVVTPDDLVASSAHRLGFRTVRVVPAETTIELDGPRIVTTPSAGSIDPEWGIVVANDDGVVYHAIDTSLGTPRDVRAFFARVMAALGRSEVTLALARWQPLLEVEAVLAGSIGFPFRAYAEELERCAAIDARVVIPSSAGVCHVGPYSGMNALVYPVTEAQFIADMRARIPHARVLPAITAGVYRVEAGEVGQRPSDLVRHVASPPDPRSFYPLAIPSLVDPHLRPIAELRPRIDRWVQDRLAPALDPSLRHVLDVVFPDAIDVYTFHNSTLRRRGDENWDVRCSVAGSLLADVIDGRRSWGDLLLGGMLRACHRVSTPLPGGRTPRTPPRAPVQPLFVYAAIPYEESVLRSVEHILGT